MKQAVPGAREPGVSVFLPTAFRYADGHLERAVDSLLRQDYDAWELLAVDDGSTDGTSGYLQALAARDSRVQHIRLERNIGLPAFTLAQAWKHARAPLFAWLFDDCEYLPHHLATLVRALHEDAGAAMAYGVATAELAGGESFSIGAPFDVAIAEGGRNVVANVCAMVRRDAIDAVGWYDPHVLMKRVCDWDLWTRIAKSRRVAFVDQVLGVERGTSLPQSLGRMCTIDMDMIRAYAQTSRNARLHPAALTEADCYRTDIGVLLDAAQRASLDLQLFEHALFTRNGPLAAESAVRIAGANGVSPLPVDAIASAAAQSMRARANVFADREIELETSSRLALAAADARAAELASAQSLVVAFREAADQRLAMLESLQREHAQMLASTQQELRQHHDAAQSFRSVADQRLAMIGDLQAALATANAIGDEFRAAADQRLELLRDAQAQNEQGVAATAALRADLDTARGRLDQVQARGEELMRALALQTDELAASRFRIDEARRVQASISGRIAFWLDRTFGA